MKKETKTRKIMTLGKHLLPRFCSDPNAQMKPRADGTVSKGDDLEYRGKNSDEGRLLAVGDIHGCLDQLRCLISRVRPREKDQFVFLGDYIDRGPDSRGVIDFLLDFRKRFPSTVFLKGNHEKMLLDYLQGKNTLLYMANGGWETLKSYETEAGIKVVPEHLDFIESLKLYYEQESFVFVHAGLRPGVSLEDHEEQDFLWIRGAFLDSDYEFKKTVVFGHTPLSSPLQEQSKLGLDTGAVYGRYLTCCDVRRRYFWDSRGCETEQSL
jgi:diadenosine tetraphosphatase ApaH/serine/threonine PP2A family protein phosphatase